MTKEILFVKPNCVPKYGSNHLTSFRRVSRHIGFISTRVMLEVDQQYDLQICQTITMKHGNSY